MKQNFSKLIDHSALLLVIAVCLSLFFFRLLEIIHLSYPMHITTSGFEEESVFALYKWIHQDPIYQDPHQPPYAASYFNWLFYAFYGSIIHLIGAEDAWIPSLGRAITVAFTVLGLIFLTPWFMSLSKSKLYALLFATIVLIGPMVDLWAITVRPDVPAFVCEILAVIFYFKNKEKFPSRALLGFILLAYCAWSFKQINLVLPGAMGLYFLSQRQWGKFTRLSLGFSSLLLTTLLVAPAPMREALLFQGTHLEFYWLAWALNIQDFLIKSFPIWLLLSYSIWTKGLKKTLDYPMSPFALCGLIVWSLIMLPASMKVGSNTNYHFLAVFFGAILALPCIPLKKLTQLNIVWCFYLVGIGYGLFTGDLRLSFQEQHRYNRQLQICANSLPIPAYYHNHYLSLPWMSPSKPNWVLAYNYWGDRERQYEFEDGGIGGLLQEQYFASLLLPQKTDKIFDQVSLESYQKIGECADKSLWIRKS